MRIVSLLPSATEILCELGLGEQIVGISHECDFPDSITDRPAVTRSNITKDASSHQIDREVRDHLQSKDALYSLDQALLEKLQPDLLVTQALCDVCAVAADEVDSVACILPSAPQVINLEPMSLQDIFDTMLMVGRVTDREHQAQQWLASAKQRTERVKEVVAVSINQPRVAFLEWLDPLFNGGHWTPELIEIAGGTDCLGGKHQPSRTQDPEVLAEAQPEILIIGQCGFDIERTREDLTTLRSLPGWNNLPCVQNNQVWLVDGNWYFNRPGPRLIDSLEILAAIFRPNNFKLAASIRPPQRLNLRS